MYSLAWAAVLLLLAGSAGAQPQAAVAKEELENLRARISKLQQQLAASETSRSEAADALKASEQAISAASRTLSDLDERARTASAQLAKLRQEAETGSGRLRSQQELLGHLIHQQYLSGRTETLKLLLNREDPGQIARHLYYFGYIARARAGLMDTLRGDLERLQTVTRETEQQAAELAAIVGEQKLQRARLEQEKRARGEVLARLARDIQHQRREISTLRQDENRLTRLIEQLAKIIARTPPPKPPAKARLRNERVPEAAAVSGPFAQLKGRLALPVRGELTNRYGSPRSDGGLTWRGLFIAAPSGQQVRAVAGGRVVFADWLRGFGNLLIIDHGDSYMSLYGFNETLFKQVGEPVQTGDSVAAVGNSGGAGDSGLYFELRHQGKPFDPLGWVNVR